MVELDAQTLRRVQLTELELLMEVDRICRKCGIGYSIIAGTMLGAVRHGGFIPWDDDTDVAMLREEYDKFREACRTELDGTKFYFQDHHETPGYRWGYGKLRRRDTLFLREHQEHMPYEQGVFVDVFPIDAVPRSWIGRALVNAQCFAVRKILWSKVGRVADKSAIRRAIYGVLSKIPERTVLRAYDAMVERSKRTESEWARILLFPTPNRQYGYLRRWYEERSDILFEGTAFPGAADYEGYLAFKFGDYMRLPPEEERKTHPVSAIRV